MAIIVSIHSFRGGTRKSNTTADLAAMVPARVEVSGAQVVIRP